MAEGPNRTHPDYPVIYGSSELGSCIKAQVAKRLGFTPLPAPEAIQAAYERGHAHEAECLAAMRAEGWEIVGEQDEYLIPCTEQAAVIVHVDGLDLTWPIRKVVEIKAPETWARFERAYKTADYADAYMVRIAWQVSCQMVATGLEAVVACLDGERLKTFVVETPIFTEREIVERVCAIEAQVLGGLPVACSQLDYPCPFLYLHEEDEGLGDADPIMDGLLVEYAQAMAAEKAAKERKERYRKDMQARLDGDTYRSQVGKVTLYTQTRTKLDVDKMTSDGIDLARYQVRSESTGLRVTFKGEADGTGTTGE